MNKQLRLFTNDIFSGLDSKTKNNSTQPCLNKQQYRAMRNKKTCLNEWFNYSISVSKMLAYCKHYDY